jgi:hypothetical protein
MAKRRCVGCARPFEPRRHVPHQRYCSRPECQRTRRRCWQREKLAADADSRANQAAAQQCWRERHPEYWRHYRRCHPDYTERNRTRQRERNRLRRRVAELATAPGRFPAVDSRARAPGARIIAPPLPRAKPRGARRAAGGRCGAAAKRIGRRKGCCRQKNSRNY